MIKKLLIIILALCMVITMLPNVALAYTPEAKWGEAEVDGSKPDAENWMGAGTLADAINYANGLSSGTAYIQLGHDIHVESPLTFDKGKAIILDLYGKTITRSTYSDSDANSPVIIVSSGELNIKDTSDTKMGSILNTNSGNDTSGIKQTGGTVNFYSGGIIAAGQAFYLVGGTFNMYGGQLIGLPVDEQATHEALGAVSNSTFNIYDGYLTGSLAYWGDTKAGAVNGNAYGGYFSDDSIQVQPGYTIVNVSDPVSITIPTITINDINFSSFSFYKTVTKTTYNINYILDGGTNGENPATYQITTPTITLAEATKTGYTFAGWFDASSGGNQVTQIALGSTGDKTLYARWTANTDTAYIVEHYQEGVSGAGYTLMDTDNLTGTTDDTATAEAKSYTGFTENTTHGSRVASGTIDADGSLVLKLYYDRNRPVAGFGKALDFASSERIDVPYNAGTKIAGQSDFTISMWVYPRDDSIYQTLYRQMNEDDEKLGLDIRLIKHDDKAYIYYAFNKMGVDWQRVFTWGDATSISNVMKIPFDQWTHVAIVKSGPNVQAYINGVADTEYGHMELGNVWYNAEAPADGIINIGMGKIEENQYFSGRMDEVQFWNVALTQAQIEAWMYREIDDTHLYDDKPVFYYKMNQSSGTSVTDFAGTNHGTFVNMDDSNWVDCDVRTWTVGAGQAVTGYLVGSDTKGSSTNGTDWNLTFEITEQGSKGTAAITSDNQFTYTAGIDKSGADSFKYKVKDGDDYYSDEHTVNIDIEQATFTVTFDKNGGSDLSSANKTVTYGETYGDLATVSREGYTFDGWYTASTGGSKIEAGTTVTITEDQTLYAQWTAKNNTQYKVEHYQQDVSGDSYRLGYTENTYGTTGSTVTAIAKTFTGFTENTTHGSRLATAAISADGSLVLKLYYDRDTFTVSFDSDEGSDVGNKTGVRYEAKITSPDAPTKTGYTFDGWYKEEGLTNAWNFASDTVTAATTLYAKWTPSTYTVTFNKNGGSDPSHADKTVTYGETYGDLATVSRAGYTFDGWYTASTGGTKIETTATVNITENQTLYAQWTVNSYTITFDSKEGSGVEPITQDYGTAVTAPAAPTKTGYTFSGWSPAVPATMPAENLTVVGQWTVNSYTITFDSAGGSAVDPITRDYGTAVTAPAAPTKTGYTFNGWDPGVPATMPAKNLTVTATYSINQYTITFDSAGGSAVDPITQDYGTAVTAPAAPTKTGYTFNGWSPAVPDTMPAENVTLTAQWTVNTYTVTFDKNGGSDPSSVDKTVTYGETYGDLATVSRGGYTFDGWYTASTGGSKIEAGTTVTITADQTLYAQWDRKKRAETEPVQPKPTQSDVIVIVNGKENVAATETITTEDEKTTVTIEVDQKAIEAKIDEAIANNPTGTGNTIQVPVSNTDAQVAKVELTGDIVKELEENSFDLLVTRDHIQYVIPAEEISTMQVAKTLGVPENDLEEIKIEVKMNRMEEEVVAKYDEMVRSNGAELIFPPVEFGITARSTKADGTTQTVEINKFSNYVERIMEIPEGVDPSKITTGVVFNRDGTYNHVPTVVFEKDGKWFAKISSLTNSTYSVIWNPVTVKSVEKHWSKDTVNDMAARLVIFNPDTFEPDKAITREDFAEYIVRALGLYREGQQIENKFTDVPSTGTRTLAILIAKEYGLVSGYPDQTFRPTQRITREEAMSMLQRAMQVTKLVGYDQDRYKNFTDFNKVSSWAQTVVKEALSAHVFNGTSATAISPKSNLTYAETAQAIKNLLVESKLIN